MKETGNKPYGSVMRLNEKKTLRAWDNLDRNNSEITMQEDGEGNWTLVTVVD